MHVPALLLQASVPVAAPCHAAVVGHVARNGDDTVPFVVMATDGRSYRLVGQDFIDPFSRKGGDALPVCPDRAEVQLTNETRGHGQLLASDSARRITYADTCYEKGSGDVAGHVVALTETTTHDLLVTFAWSEGALQAPVRATATYDPARSEIAFVAATGQGFARFRGTLRRHVLRGQLSEPWSGQARSVVLTRRSAIAAYRPTASCRPLESAAIGRR